MLTTLRQGMATLFIAVTTITLFSAPARADVVADLQALNTQATALQAYLEGVQLNADSTTLCGPLVQANNLARDMVNSITAVDDSLAAPLQLDADVLAGIEGLSNTTLSLANEALRLSVDLQSLSTAVDMITLKDALAAMLQLSTDIGAMADRIGEMADNILVMSDNIGLMADAAVRRWSGDGIAVHALGFLREPFDETGAVSDLGPGFGDRLALFQRHQHGQVFLVFHDQLVPPAQHHRTLLSGTSPPVLHRAVGRLDGAAGLRRTAVRHPRDFVTVGGIGHGKRRGFVALAPRAVDEGAGAQ